MQTRNAFATIVLVVVLGVFLCLCISAASLVNINNTIVNKDENIRQQWAQVGVALQRRVDLYGTLESITVAGAIQDQAVFGILRDQAAALAGAMRYDQAGNVIPPTETEVEELGQALDDFDQALANVLVYLADNPDQVQSMELYQNFQVQAEGTENRISVERRRYNEMVGDARRYCRTFPNSLVCGILGYSPDDWVYFQPETDAWEVPELDFTMPNEQGQ